jgi:hypothetical protein
MCQYGDDERRIIQQFQKSLTGPALSWFFQLDHVKIKTWSDLANAFLAQYRFNSEMAPDRYELQRMLKKANESFRSYAQRSRERAAQVKPPMRQKEMVTTFLNTLKDPYYAHLIGHTTSSFADLVIVGERVEDGIKSGRLIDTHLLQTLMEQQSGAGTSQRRPAVKRPDAGSKGADVQMITTTPQSRREYPHNPTVYRPSGPSQGYHGPTLVVPQQAYVPHLPQVFQAPPAQVVPPQGPGTRTRTNRERELPFLFHRDFW